MEVLISMGVLAVGLLGVAALIPAGRYQVAQGSRLEYASMVGRSALREIKVRGLLNPGGADGSTSTLNWVDGYTTGANPWVTGVNGASGSNGTGYAAWNGTAATTLFSYRYNSSLTTTTNQCAVAIDPLAITAPAGSYKNLFPYNAPIPSAGVVAPRPLLRIVPFLPSSYPAQTFDAIFRSSVDLITRTNTANSELPPVQYYLNNGTTPLRRASDGSYSWLATVVSDPSSGVSALSTEVTVSVAVFYKRDLSTPGAGEFIASGHSFPSNNEISLDMTNIVSNTMPAQPIKPARPGQWIMVAGKTGSGIYTPSYYRWYKVISAGPPQSSIQRITVRGPDWLPYWVTNPTWTNIWLFDNIVSVFEKTMPLEVE